jgi:hypothetical protein
MKSDQQPDLRPYRRHHALQLAPSIENAQMPTADRLRQVAEGEVAKLIDINTSLMPLPICAYDLRTTVWPQSSINRIRRSSRFLPCPRDPLA